MLADDDVVASLEVGADGRAGVDDGAAAKEGAWADAQGQILDLPPGDIPDEYSALAHELSREQEVIFDQGCQSVDACVCAHCTHPDWVTKLGCS